MKIIKSPQYLLVCRSAFCLKCWQAERPIKGNRFLVYGTDSQSFKSKFVHNGGYKGFVPHLYMVEVPYKLSEEGLVTTTKTCLMDGCGIRIGKLLPNGNLEIEILNPQWAYLSQISVEALISLWHGRTGYELF